MKAVCLETQWACQRLMFGTVELTMLFIYCVLIVVYGLKVHVYTRFLTVCQLVTDPAG